MGGEDLDYDQDKNLVVYLTCCRQNWKRLFECECDTRRKLPLCRINLQ